MTDNTEIRILEEIIEKSVDLNRSILENLRSITLSNMRDDTEGLFQELWEKAFPESLPFLILNWDYKQGYGIISHLIGAFSDISDKVNIEITLQRFRLEPNDIEAVLNHFKNLKGIAFEDCEVKTNGLELANVFYKTKNLEFKGCSHSKNNPEVPYEESTMKIDGILNAISNCKLKDSLKKLNLRNSKSPFFIV